MAVNMNKAGVVRLTGKDMTQLRVDMFVRDKSCCVVCGKWCRFDADPLDPRSGHMAHIIPRSRGGSDTLENVRLLCRDDHLIGDHNPKSVPAKERA